MTTFRCKLLLGVLLAVSACDTDLYQDTSACRDDDQNTVCAIDGSRDGQTKSDAAQLGGEYEACVRADRASCDDEELARQDNLLNAKYRAVLARLGSEEQRTLQDSERSWIAERDKRCAADARRGAEEATVMGAGAAAETVDTMCRIEETKSRIRWLDRFGETNK